MVTNDDEVAHRIAYIRNFGHKGQEDFWGLGINGKNSEFHAAMGLCILPKVSELISKRKFVSEMYDILLNDIGLSMPKRLFGTYYNYSYYPVIFESEEQLFNVRDALNAQRIFPRRYFYPSLNKLPYVEISVCPFSDDIARRVLCLPLYDSLKAADIERTSLIIKNAL